MRYVFFDIETNGLPKAYGRPYWETENFPRIVQLAYVVTNEDGVILSKHMNIIKPDGWDIPDEVAKIHRIDRDLAANGVEMAYAISTFMKSVQDVDLVIAHNITFDATIISSEAHRLGYKKPTIMGFLKHPKVDTMHSTTEFCNISKAKGSGAKWPRLSELHAILFGEEMIDAHDALVDVEYMVKCYFECVKHGIIKPHEKV